MADKKHFKLFVSHATTDDDLVTDFFNGISGHLKDNVGVSVDFLIDHKNVLRNASLFHPELMKELKESDGAVFCISSDALNSKYIGEHELSTMFLRFLDGGFPLCIVLLRDYAVSNHEALKHLQHIVVQTHELYPQYTGEKKGTKPLNFAEVRSEKRKLHGLLDANDLDKYFVTVADRIRSYLLDSHPSIPNSKEGEAIRAWALQKKKEGDEKTNKNTNQAENPSGSKENPFTPAPQLPDIIEDIDLGNGVVMEFVFVEGGSFMMGDERKERADAKQHLVKLDGFYICKYPVTQEQWSTVMGGSNPSHFKKPANPVEKISYSDAIRFIQELRKIANEQFSSPVSFRLPTEAEWEYAARGGRKSKGFLYAGDDTLDEVAWYKANSSGEPHPVGEHRPNELGIYDLSGNVAEWCLDWYDKDYYLASPKKDPKNIRTPRNQNPRRVVRGGYYSAGELACRVASRSSWPEKGNTLTGFRCVISPDEI